MIEQVHSSLLYYSSPYSSNHRQFYCGTDYPTSPNVYIDDYRYKKLGQSSNIFRASVPSTPYLDDAKIASTLGIGSTSTGNCYFYDAPGDVYGRKQRIVTPSKPPQYNCNSNAPTNSCQQQPQLNYHNQQTSSSLPSSATTDFYQLLCKQTPPRQSVGDINCLMESSPEHLSPTPQPHFAKVDRLRREFRLKQTEFATYAKKLRLVDASSAYYTVVADHLLRVQAELNELANQMAECVITDDMVPSNKRHVLADTLGNNQSENNGDWKLMERSIPDTEVIPQKIERTCSSPLQQSDDHAVPFRTFGAIQRKLLTSLEVEPTEVLTSDQPEEPLCFAEDNHRLLSGGEAPPEYAPPPPPSHPPPLVPLVDENYSTQHQTSSETDLCRKQRIAETNMSSAVASQQQSGVDTSSIYDALSVGGVALRRVIQSSPHELFANNEKGDRPESPKFNRIAITSRFAPPSPDKTPSTGQSQALSVRSESEDNELLSVNDLKKKYDMHSETPSARKLMADQSYQFRTGRANLNSSHVEEESVDEPIIEMESIDASTEARFAPNATMPSSRGVRRFQFFVKSANSSQHTGMLQKLSEERPEDVVVEAQNDIPATLRDSRRSHHHVIVDASDKLKQKEKSINSNGLSSNKMESPNESKADLNGDHSYDELNVTSAITESDIEDFNEVLDGTRDVSERLSDTEMARIDSLRTSLRSKSGQSDDEPHSFNKENQEQRLTETGGEESIKEGPSISTHTDDLQTSVQKDTQPNKEDATDSETESELVAASTAELPTSVHGLDEYDLTKKRLQEDPANAGAVHWKTRFSQPSSPTAPLSPPPRPVSPKEATRLLMLDDAESNVGIASGGKVNFATWDARTLVKRLYAVAAEGGEGDENSKEQQHVYVNREGFLERLMQGGRLNNSLKTWRRKYIRLRDGVMYTSEKETDPIEHFRTLQSSLAGARISPLPEPDMFSVEETNGRWSVFRCTSEEERQKWLDALETQIVELSAALRYLTPLIPKVGPADSLEDLHSKKILIVDIGECSIRAGVLRNRPSLPDLFFPAVGAKVSAGDSDNYKTVFGIDAYAPVSDNSKIHLTQPFKMSTSGEKSLSDFDCLSGVFNVVLDQLAITEPSDYAVLVTIPFELSTSDRIQLTSLIKGLGFSKYFISTQEPMALYAYGCTDGVVVQIGEHLSVMPVVAGCAMIGGCLTLPYGGHDLMDAFNATLPGKHLCSFSTPKECLIVRYLAENLCYVSNDYERDLNACLQNRSEFAQSIDLSNCDLPQGLPAEFAADWGRFHAAERIVNPSVSYDSPSVGQIIFNAIKACPIDSRRELYRNIIVSGGPACLPGLTERLEADVQKLLPTDSSLQVRVNKAPFAYHASFVGATVLASKPEFENLLKRL